MTAKVLKTDDDRPLIKDDPKPIIKDPVKKPLPDDKPKKKQLND